MKQIYNSRAEQVSLTKVLLLWQGKFMDRAGNEVHVRDQQEKKNENNIIFTTRTDQKSSMNLRFYYVLLNCSPERIRKKQNISLCS